VREEILPLKVRVILEPGRSVAGDAGALISRVINVKKSAHKTFVILDAAMNDLMRPALYDAYHAVWPLKKAAGAKVSCDIVGPVCETGDTFHTDEKMQALKTGDLVALMCAGAYGSSMSSTYNTRPLVAEVLVRGGKFEAVRRAQTVEDLLADEIIPEWME
jgi:diaminopimelate decarboxylase